MALTVTLTAPADDATGVTNNTFGYTVAGTGTYDGHEILIDGAQVYYLVDHANLTTGAKTYDVDRNDFTNNTAYTWQVKVRESDGGAWKSSAVADFTMVGVDAEESAIYPADEALVVLPAYGFFASWVTGGSISNAELYLGTAPGSLAYHADVEDLGARDGAEIDMSTLRNDTTYYWAIYGNYYWFDGVVIASSIYSFTAGKKPEKPTTPGPANAGTTKLGLELLTWEAG